MVDNGNNGGVGGCVYVWEMYRVVLIVYVILLLLIVEVGNVIYVVENDEVDFVEVWVFEEMCGWVLFIICCYLIFWWLGGIRVMDEFEMECGFYVKGFCSFCMLN